MSEPVLNKILPVIPWTDPAAWRLPGLQPLGDAPWLMKTDSFAGQMALRDRLIGQRPESVHAMQAQAAEAADECLNAVLDHLRGEGDYRVNEESVTRPDGRHVPIDRAAPLVTAGLLVQEDFCLMLAGADEYLLGGAILCFPAGWTLAEKIGRPLTAIHGPVAEYDANVARRVQRIFEGIKTGRPMWRANAILHDTPELHTPLREGDPIRRGSGAAPFLRSERQTLRRLPGTGSVVFTILSSVVKVEELPDDARAALEGARIKRSF
jgi:hypothetical protein